MKIKEKVLKELKPKILDVLKLEKDNVILTDSYSFRDLYKAIDLTLAKVREEIEIYIKSCKENCYCHLIIEKEIGYDIKKCSNCSAIDYLKELLPKLGGEE